MESSTATISDIKCDRFLGHLPENVSCRSATLVGNFLIAVQLYKGTLLNYESSSIALFNSRTNRLIKSVNVCLARPPSNIQQHILLATPDGKFLVACDDFGVIIFSVERAFKAYAKYNVPNTIVELPLPHINMTQPLTKVRLHNSNEIIMAKGSSLIRWDFLANRAPTQLPNLITFPSEAKIADFTCDSERDLLVVMLEQLLSSQHCKIILYDLTDMTQLSSYKFNCMLLNRFWTVDMESGSISVMQSELTNQNKRSHISFLRITDDFKIRKWKSYDVDGWPLPVLNSSTRYSCIVISQMVGNLIKRIWGYFDYAEDRIFKTTCSFTDDNSESKIPRVHKIFEFFDNLDLFIGSHHGRMFLTRRERVIDSNETFPTKNFWKSVANSAK